MKLITKNKIAYLDYDILDTYDVWLVLLWHEVKAIKGNHVNIKDAIISMEDKALTIINMDIPLYERTSPLIAPWYKAKGKRLLLAKKIELAKIVSKTTKTWLSIVPLELYIATNGKIKLKIGIGKLRRKVEKKQVIKEREMKREMTKEIKQYT